MTTREEQTSSRKMSSKDFTAIIAKVSEVYNVTRKYLTDGERSSSQALSRHVAMYLCRSVHNATFDDIADRFNRKRPTVIRNVGKIASLVKRDKSFGNVVASMELTLSPAGAKAGRGEKSSGRGMPPSSKATATGSSPAGRASDRARKGAIAA